MHSLHAGGTESLPSIARNLLLVCEVFYDNTATARCTHDNLFSCGINQERLHNNIHIIFVEYQSIENDKKTTKQAHSTSYSIVVIVCCSLPVELSIKRSRKPIAVLNMSTRSFICRCCAPPVSRVFILLLWRAYKQNDAQHYKFVKTHTAHST